MVVEGRHNIVAQPRRRQRLRLRLDPPHHFQRFRRLIEPQGHDLIRVMDEVQDELAIQGQERSDLGLLVVAARVLLEQPLIEQVVDEDVAVFVSDEEVFAQDLYVVDFGGKEEGLLEGDALDVVVAYHL